MIAAPAALVLTLFQAQVETVPAQAPPTPAEGRAELRTDSPAWRVTYGAKVQLEDGSAPGIEPEVTVLPASLHACRIDIVSPGSIVFRTQLSPDPCIVIVRMPGYRSVVTGLVDGKTIVLKRVGEAEGYAVSLTILAAPPTARKLYQQGVAALQQRRSAPARRSFEAALKLYPKYAPAWSGIGSVEELDGRLEAAAQAYRRAIAEDRRYLKPYQQLAAVLAQARRWQDVLSESAPALELNPIEFPGLFYFRAVASLNLEQSGPAIQNARRSIDLDPHHEYPRAYLVLGWALARQADRAHAIEALATYLSLVPNAPDADAVRSLIAKLS